MSIIGFDIEWFDPISELTHKMFLKFFLEDKTIEILTEKSTFLKRIFYPEVTLSDLFVGNSITIYNRLYNIRGYTNKFTAEYMRTHEARFSVNLATSDLPQLSSLLATTSKYRLVPGRIYSFYPGVTLVEIVGTSGQNYDRFIDECRQKGFDIARSTNAEIEDIIKNAEMLRLQTPCTLALIKPHILKSGRVGELLEAIAHEREFTISALFSFHFTIVMAEELFDAYRGIVDDYSKFIENICSGQVLAVAVSGRYEGEDIVSAFRELTGPNNPQIAKALRPQSLRARFGVTAMDNALHCTDLPEDGEMECRYIFETLARIK